MSFSISWKISLNRVKKELENERFATLIKLSRVLDDETLSKCINVLGYTLNVK